MNDEKNRIEVSGLWGVLLVFAGLFLGILLFTRIMEFLTLHFTFLQLATGFFLLIPGAMLLRYCSVGALILNRDEINQLYGGISIFLFMVFAVCFFYLENLLFPQITKDALEKGGIFGYLVGAGSGILMLACFAVLMKLLNIKKYLKASLEGYKKN
jgi:hypothetical protein